MEVKTFCSSMRREMTGWREKIHELVRKTEKTSTAPRREVKTSIDEMKKMIGRIEGVLERLETQCPVSWDSEKSEIEQAVCDIRDRWNEAAAMSPDDLE